MWFPQIWLEKILTRRHRPHFTTMTFSSSRCALLPSQLSATWLLWPHRLYVGLFNGRGSLAWGRAWQKLQRGGAGRRCELWSLGPEEGSSWSPGAFLEKRREKEKAQLYLFASLFYNNFLLPLMFQYPTIQS